MKITTELFAVALTAIGGITTVAVWGGRVDDRITHVEDTVAAVAPVQDVAARLDERTKTLEKKTEVVSDQLTTLQIQVTEQTVILRELRQASRRNQ